MSYRIICPYCFREMQDDEVNFRSELVHKGESDIIPDEYDDVEDFIARYSGDDKEEILARYRDWDFFLEAEDETYENFWKNFNGTTENNPADEMLGVKAYHRKVIDPGNPEHRRFIRRQPDDTYFIRDEDGNGMVTQIELVTGELCNRRVCPSCHNPLPTNYGKTEVKFVTIVGITGAGKTVYISQLLKRMSKYSAKVGLATFVKNTGVGVYLEQNQVEANLPLPGPTPYQRFQQPLFYELVRSGENDRRITETFVLYDVAGEVFKDADLVHRAAPFISHANGIIVLIDPMQFEVISDNSKEGKKLDDPEKVFNSIHDQISGGVMDRKCDIPLAVCISKVDTEAVQRVLSDELCTMLLDDVHEVKDGVFNKTEFNAKEYNPIAKELWEFIVQNEMALASTIDKNYSHYSYFAFTALGCDVKEENGVTAPVGPVLPKRLEEPILWMFHELGYISENETLYQFGKRDIECPSCGRPDTIYDLPPEEQVETKGWGPFKKVTYYNKGCRGCGCRFDYIEEHR